MIKRFASASVFAFTILLVGAIPALAAVPPNDRFPNAMPVTSVPFANVVNTSGATLAVDDPSCGDESHTVWYRFTPTQSARYQFGASTDGFNPAVSVYSGPRSALSQIACNYTFSPETLVRADLQAGTTYRIMVGTLVGRSDPTLTGGKLTFKVTKPLLPSVQFTFGRATVDRVSGVVQIRGTMTCAGSATYGQIDSRLRQVRNGFRAAGSGQAFSDTCGSTPKRWTMRLESETNRAFLPGWASLDFTTTACDAVDCLPAGEGIIRIFLNGV